MEQKELNVKTPKYLYRYFSWEQGVELLATQRLKLSKVSYYNDPFEFFPASEYTDKLSNYNKSKMLGI